jgi:hypothetical protein
MWFRLDTSFNRSTEAQGLDLQRDLRQAIAEYAPESEVVARKKIWDQLGLEDCSRKAVGASRL